MNTRDLLHRKFPLGLKYKESRDTIKEILTETERNYTFLEVQKNKSNPSSLWKVINRVIPSKNKEPQRVYTKDLKKSPMSLMYFLCQLVRLQPSLLVILQKLITSLGREIFLTLSGCRVKGCDALFHLCS